jgi:hypothetical protein
MFDAPVLLRNDLQERSGHGQHRYSIQQNYIPNADPDEHDPHAAWDLMVAKAFTRVLLDRYPGHFWEVTVSRKQGIAAIAIPILMGPTQKYVLKLSEDLQPPHIWRAGGEILERFNIPRSGMDLTSFLTARARATKTFSRDRTPT